MIIQHEQGESSTSKVAGPGDTRFDFCTVTSRSMKFMADQLIKKEAEYWAALRALSYALEGSDPQ